MAFHIANQRARENRNIIGVACIQDENGNLKTENGKRFEVWRRYCERLMNVENYWDGEVNYVPVEDPWEVTEKEVWEVLKRMKKGNSSGPSKVSCEVFSNDMHVRELCGVAKSLLIGTKNNIICCNFTSTLCTCCKMH